MRLNNPAARLLETLRKTLEEPPKGNVAITVWALALGVTDKDQVRILEGISQLKRLITESQELIEDHASNFEQDEKEILLRPFPNIAMALDIAALMSEWRQIKALLDPATMLALEVCAIRLSRLSDEHEIADKELNCLLEKIQIVKQDIEASQSFEDEFKHHLVLQLNLLQQSILKYELYGAEGLKKACEEVIVAMRYEIEMYNEYREDPVLQEFGKVVSWAWHTVAVALASQLKERVAKEIEEGVRGLLQAPKEC